MAQRISDTKPVTDFIDIAAQFCLLIESKDKNNALQLLQEAYIILPQLCLCRMRLPEIKKFTDYDPPDKSVEQFFVMYNSLKSKFKGYDVYREIFDPCDPKDNEFIQYTISGDISEIYEDIKPGLQVWEKTNAGEKRTIIWKWKLLFEKHWGDHATTAFRALFYLLNNHIKDEDGDSVGIRKDIKEFKPAEEL